MPSDALVTHEHTNEPPKQAQEFPGSLGDRAWSLGSRPSLSPDARKLLNSRTTGKAEAMTRLQERPHCHEAFNLRSCLNIVMRYVPHMRYVAQ